MTGTWIHQQHVTCLLPVSYSLFHEDALLAITIFKAHFFHKNNHKSAQTEYCREAPFIEVHTLQRERDREREGGGEKDSDRERDRERQY